jgi:hypothetical protein
MLAYFTSGVLPNRIERQASESVDGDACPHPATGTTGPPKLVPRDFAYAAAHAATALYWLDLREGEHTSSCGRRSHRRRLCASSTGAETNENERAATSTFSRTV